MMFTTLPYIFDCNLIIFFLAAFQFLQVRSGQTPEASRWQVREYLCWGEGLRDSMWSDVKFGGYFLSFWLKGVPCSRIRN